MLAVCQSVSNVLSLIAWRKAMATVSLCTVWLLPHVSTAHGSVLAADAGQDRGVIQDSFVLPIIPDIQQYVWNTNWKNGIWYTEWPTLCNLEDANGDLITDSQLYSLHHLHSMITHISNMDPPPPYVHHVGDIVEDHHEDVPGDCEWEISDCLMRKLENAGIPWGMSVGNHESCFQSRNNISSNGGEPWCEYIYDSHSNNLEDLMLEFDEFFPRSRWESMPGVSTGSYDSANLDDSPSMMFSWHSFNAGNGFVDNKWLVVNIGWFECDDNSGPSYANCIDAIGRVFVPGDEGYLNTDYYYPITDDVYSRLNQLIKSHADHSVIIGQHRLIQHNQWTPQGYLTYHNLVKDNPNVKLMLCGHHIETEHQHIVEHIAGEDGVLRQVHVIMINYQNINGGGDGYFHETTITDRGGGADFRTYSPSLGQYADPAEYPNSSFDISFGPVGDVNRDGLVDSIDLQQVQASGGPCVGCIEDIDLSGEVDLTDIQLVVNNCPDCSLIDCNDNGVPDNVDLDTCDGSSWCSDCNGNNFLDACDIDFGLAEDCNANQVPDGCDIASDPTQDCDGNGVLDSCQATDDCDGSGLPDSCDIASDPELDCNGNGQIDSCEILDDGGLDSDGSGVLDECECLADVNDDCSIGVDDLLLVIGGWGSSKDELADINSDGTVGVDDLLLIMASWGLCAECL